MRTSQGIRMHFLSAFNAFLLRHSTSQTLARALVKNWLTFRLDTAIDDWLNEEIDGAELKNDKSIFVTELVWINR